MKPTARRVVAGLGLWAGAVAVNRSLRRVNGSSMAPTLRPGELVVALPVRRPRRGEVVLLGDPRDPTVPTSPSGVQVKRVIGLPGETVEVRDGTLLIDGRRHREAHQHGRGPDGRLEVPAGHVAVLGDARDASTDSRTYGPVPLELVTHRVPLVLRPWPHRLRSAPTRLEPAAPAARQHTA